MLHRSIFSDINSPLPVIVCYNYDDGRTYTLNILV